VESHALPVDLYTNAVDSKGRAFTVGGTPETLVVAPNGKITDIWQGAYSPTTQNKVESKFGVQLPGLIMTASATPAPAIIK
jgi:hypothetical protein